MVSERVVEATDEDYTNMFIFIFVYNKGYVSN